ncbi:vacuolar protein sorting-associated protein 11 homolog [Chrysoperla carnea]|uniref:vacuolar protein sorting-associated protein 11 homolog n=1 Tax=Chrysoperla carnea TaxID=189513 RepID=UPI001D07B46C|nr:vacuolar protein sorting-associated protein 11 homolog [Chrysoperla carnea]
MAFLEWRWFNFFDLKQNIDRFKVSEALGEATVTAYSSGNGHIVLGDTNGFVHLVSRAWNIISFKGYETTISHTVQLKQSPILVTIGEDESGLNALVKVWDTEKLDKNDTPMCVRILRPPPMERNYGARPPIATAVCAQSNLLVVGMSDGTIWLRRGDLTRDRGTRQRTMRDVKEAITGLAIRTTQAKQTFLFVSTTANVFLYNITVKDKEFQTSLDSIGCTQRCSILAETSSQESHFMIARDNAVYCYTPDGRGPCYAVDGDKIMLDWFRSYLVIVSRNNKQSTSTTTSTSAIPGVNNTADGTSHLVTVLDTQNKFLVFQAPIQQVKAVLNEWGGFYIIDGKNQMYHLEEKDLQSKLSLLFKKNLYDVSIRMAKNQQYDNDSLIDIFRQYGDHLYAKGDHAGAIDQYIKTIGKLESSYVIRKFLDSQHIDKLTLYLQALHKMGQATENHTTLLLNCYTKLDHRDKLKQFILTKDRELDFDIDIAIRVCRRVSSDDALLLAKKYEKHDWYLKIQIEDQKKYSEALTYIENLNFNDASLYFKKYGKILIENVPTQSVEFLKKLCSDFNSTSYDSKDTSTDENGSIINRCNPDEFIHLFLNNTEILVEFLEYLVEQPIKYSSLIYDTLIENYITLWHRGIQANEIETKVLNLLQNVDANFDKNQALIICQTHGFSPGVLYLYEDAKLYQQILRYQMRQKDGDMQAALACCKRYGHQEPTLWVQALWYCARNVDTESTDNNKESLVENILPEILNVIAKERLLSPLMVLDCLCSSSTITLGVVRKYLNDVMLAETKLADKERENIEKYKEDTSKLRAHIKQLRDEPIVFQGSRCAACHHQLELPAIHCLCQHSYHQHCFQSFSDNESDCPACQPENKQLSEMIRSQQSSRDLHETFFSQLDRAEDTFSLLSEYFGRGVFNKLTVLTDSTLITSPSSQIIAAEPILTGTDYSKLDVNIANRNVIKKEEPNFNYGPGVENRLRLNEGNIPKPVTTAIAEHQKPNQRATRPTNIPASEGRMRLEEQRFDLQYSSSLEANLTRTNFPTVRGGGNAVGGGMSKSNSMSSNSDSTKRFGKSTPSGGNNPFEDEDPTYDDTLNPFGDIKAKDPTNPFEADDDYDKNLNPFE